MFDFLRKKENSENLSRLFDSKTGMKKSDSAFSLKSAVDRTTVSAGIQLLQKYKAGKAVFDNTVIENDLFWRQRFNEYNSRLKKNDDGSVPRPSSAWLFNTVANKHADMMDSLPQPVILPRERSDEDSAKMLSSIIPVILDRSDFEKVYSDACYDKIKNGTAAYGVFWNPGADNGLGEVEVKKVDILNLFWEPGILDLQQSKNVFCVALCDDEDIINQYPESGFKGGSKTIDVAEYVHDDYIDTSGKTLVVDWYYKKTVEGRTTLQFIKFAGDTLLFASENDERFKTKGFYAHGMYPFVLDVLFPESGTPYGFGIISVIRDVQVYIDRLDQAILEHALLKSRPRFFIKRSAGINREDFLDTRNQLIEVEGDVTQEKIRSVTVPPLDSGVLNVRAEKIAELKEVAANRDVNSGGTGSGVTSGAAIATLQEAGNKMSRDIISGTYRAFVEVIRLVIECIREFYDTQRTFRIINPNNTGYEFADFSNENIREQSESIAGETLCRVPIFDINVQAQKHSPYARLSQNETVINLYKLGFFNPENAQSALIALDSLEFEGKDKIISAVKEGDTLYKTCAQLKERIDALERSLSSVNASEMSGMYSSDGTPGISEYGMGSSDMSAPGAGTNSISAHNAHYNAPDKSSDKSSGKVTLNTLDRRVSGSQNYIQNKIKGGESYD